MKSVVLVTGASGELGMSIIKKYASNGYNVVINYNLNRKNALAKNKGKYYDSRKFAITDEKEFVEE